LRSHLRLPAFVIPAAAAHSEATCRVPLLAAALLAVTSATLVSVPAAAQGKPLPLLPHRAVYDLTLDKGSKTIEAARGRIALEFRGNACEGYTLQFRQLTVLESAEIGQRASDVRTTTFESGDGREFRFRSDTVRGSGAPQVTDGRARIGQDGAASVVVSRPERGETTFSGERVVFPTAHLVEIIAAAQAGQTIHEVKVFDGSEDGKTAYETLAVIGRRINAGGAAPTEPAAASAALTEVARWPVKISYFAPGTGERTPIYSLGFDLYAHGVGRALKLDYGDFSLSGELKQFEALPATPCER
jgi:hypothetical protein